MPELPRKPKTQPAEVQPQDRDTIPENLNNIPKPNAPSKPVDFTAIVQKQMEISDLYNADAKDSPDSKLAPQRKDNVTGQSQSNSILHKRAKPPVYRRMNIMQRSI